MPKQDQSPHFDAVALLTEVHKQDHGLHVSTNDPDGFRRLVYQAARAVPSLAVHIYSSLRSKRRLILLKRKLESPSHAES